MSQSRATKKFSNSLAFRLLAVTAAWTSVALIATGLLLSTLFRQNAESNFEGLLLAHAYNLMGAIDVGQDGKLTGAPDLGDPRFLQPLSGWYWAVSTAQKPDKPLLRSISLGGADLAMPDEAEQPFDDLFRRSYTVPLNDNEDVQRLEAQLLVGEGDTLYQVLVAGSRAGLEETVSSFNRIVSIFFLVFGLGTILATYFVIRFGLRPLERATSALSDVREGKTDNLAGDYPHEVAPLVFEINKLIDANRSVVERARTQVGNLAHALKTPLAVIQNETRSPSRNTGSLVSEQTVLMQSQIQNYLDRARIAAQRGALTSRCNVMPVVERLIRVMSKLSPDLEFQVKSEDQKVLFQGEEQDLEEILGNLLENASRFARKKVVVNVSVSGPMLHITVEDDGPGLGAQEKELAIKRGQRLDETKPGSGLGLSIVKDIIEEYEGRFELHDAKAKGLIAAVFLPRIETRNEKRP